MNGLASLERCRNRYFVMRHGESEANREGIILSSPDSGTRLYGLTPHGRRQALESVRSCTQLDPELLIYSSDFKRALETARVVHGYIGCRAPIRTDPALRERYFGEWERTSNAHYRQVWSSDERDPDHREHGVESANEVMKRVTSLIVRLEGVLRDQTILLVSHGDALQILQTAFCKQTADRHRALEHLNTAEIRELNLNRVSA